MQQFDDKTIKKLTTLKSYDFSAVDYAKNTELLHPYVQGLKFVQMLPKKPKIIDIGCGPGRDAKIFTDMGAEVVGVDFSSKMIELAKHNAPEASFHVMDIESLAFPSETFDGAWANCSLLHIPKVQIPAVLGNIHSILKPQGILFLSLKQGNDESFEPDERYEGIEKFWSLFQADELKEMLNQVGFTIIELGIYTKDDQYHTHEQIKLFARKHANTTEQS